MKLRCAKIKIEQHHDDGILVEIEGVTLEAVFEILAELKIRVGAAKLLNMFDNEEIFTQYEKRKGL